MNPYNSMGSPKELANAVRSNHVATINCTSSSTDEGINPSVGHQGTWRS
jgi:hypothetical protein